MTRIKLAKNFYLDEFLRSQTASRHGVDMTPTEAVVENLRRLATTILQPVRNVIGPVHITSGYRPPQLNRLLRGSKKSQHVLGLAADIVASGHTPIEVCRIIEQSLLPFDQIILEFDEWTHVSIAPNGVEPRREVLTSMLDENGRATYVTGLPTNKECL